MLTPRRHGLTIAACAALVSLYSFPAAAYIDAGTASLIFQALIAGGLAGLLVVKQFWANIKAFVQSMFHRGSAPKPGD